MIRIIALIFAVMVPVQAAALSCVAPSIKDTFEQAQKSSDVYVVVHGEVVVDMRKMPRAHKTTQQAPKMTSIPAKIRGRSLSKAGFRTPFEREITLEVACFGPWCGSIQSGAKVLAFLRRDKDGYALAVNPCGGDVFVTPQAKMLKQAERCFRRGSC